jgi:hypothetical protein
MIEYLQNKVPFGRQNCHMLLTMDNFGIKSTNEWARYVNPTSWIS